MLFRSWAPNARAIDVRGDWNGWSGDALARVADTGVWEAFVPGAAEGHRYKYAVTGADGTVVDKADPYARADELPPGNASIIDVDHHEWRDDAWMADRAERNAPHAPMSIYEVHLGSWRRVPDDGDRMLTYREAAPLLIAHCHEYGFTHVELLPVMEHPYGGSWGYQVTGFFAPTARHGSPDDLRALVDATRRNDGCIAYDVAEDPFEPGLLRFSELWPDHASLDRHLGAPHIAPWRSATRACGLIARQFTAYDGGRGLNLRNHRHLAGTFLRGHSTTIV